jgi:hypothetical protein
MQGFVHRKEQDKQLFALPVISRFYADWVGVSVRRGELVVVGQGSGQGTKNVIARYSLSRICFGKAIANCTG